MAGNPNPSPETRFQPGNPGGGKTSAQRKLEYEAAEIAAKVRHRLLSVIAEKLALNQPDAEVPQDALAMLTSDTLRLLKDSEDRAHGTPKQAVDHTSSDGSMTPPDNASAALLLQAHLDAIARRTTGTAE